MDQESSANPSSGLPSLRPVLPLGVIVRERRTDVEEALLPFADRLAIAEASEQRRRESLTVRWCAHAALDELGRSAPSIPRAASGEPIWPTGVIGSLTHCDGYRAATVALSSHFRAIGIDAEPHHKLPPDVENLVTTSRERKHLQRLHATHPSIAWDRLLFSAKESIYKASFPLTQQWLDFIDVEVWIDPDSGTFDARIDNTAGLHKAGLPADVTGVWVAGDHLLTAVLIGA